MLHILVLVTAALAITTALLTQPATPSPSSHPNIAPSTSPGSFTACDQCNTRFSTRALQPELRRRQIRRQLSDSLGWDEPLACNIGICTTDQYCTVFEVQSLRDSIATGACCYSTETCTSRSTCLHYTSHTFSNVTAVTYSGGTMFCGVLWPQCSISYVQYGYGLGTLVEVNCWNGTSGPVTTTFRNPSWKLYAVETNPSKGPKPTMQITSTEPESSSSTSSSRPTAVPTIPALQEQKGFSLPIGAIAGIIIGSIVLIVIGIMVVIAFRHKLRHSNRGVIQPFQTKELVPTSPAPVYTNSMGYQSPHQPVYQTGAGTSEASTGLRNDAGTVLPGARQN
ncbi:hypothetical protein BDD12DRAFT_983553 [Trichophaea hybrida]|nr:hypothetical protein BDD12DRAFT_983553 [Trichophaea hybrida]